MLHLGDECLLLFADELTLLEALAELGQLELHLAQTAACIPMRIHCQLFFKQGIAGSLFDQLLPGLLCDLFPLFGLLLGSFEAHLVFKSDAFVSIVCGLVRHEGKSTHAIDLHHTRVAQGR